MQCMWLQKADTGADSQKTAQTHKDHKPPTVPQKGEFVHPQARLKTNVTRT